jgi:hypothetical protein
MKIPQRALGYSLQPGIELASLARTLHERELLDELVGNVDLLVDLTELVNQ